VLGGPVSTHCKTSLGIPSSFSALFNIRSKSKEFYRRGGQDNIAEKNARRSASFPNKLDAAITCSTVNQGRSASSFLYPPTLARYSSSVSAAPKDKEDDLNGKYPKDGLPDIKET